MNETGNSAMFKDPKDEDRICGVLKAWVEEFGPEHLIVHLPVKWQNPDYSLGPTKLAFDTQGSIDIEVNWKNVHLRHKLELASV